MAISTPAIVISPATNDQNATDRTTAAGAPTVGSCFVLAAYARETTGGAPAPDIGLTATQGTWSFTEYTVSDSKTNRHTLSAWKAVTPSYGSNPAFVVDPDENCNRWGWLAFEILGTNSATVIQSKTGTSSSATPSLTLDSPPSADNIVIGICASVALGAGITPGSGYTEIGDTANANLTALQAQWRTGSTSTTVAWADCGTTSNLLIALEIEAATVSTRKLRARSANTADTSFTAEINLGDLAAGRMYAGVATFDATGNQVALYLHDGTSATQAATGTMATQTGDLALGNSYASSAVINQSIAALVGPRIATFETVLGSGAISTLLGQLADEVRPRVSDYALDISGLASTSVDLSGVVKDPTAWGWSIVSAAPLDDGHWISPLATNAKSFTVNPVGAAGTTSAQIVVSNAFGNHSRTASLTVTMTKAADDTAVGSWPWLLYPLPTGLPTVTVSDRATLDSEIASASSGTGKRIVVTGTITGGTLTISKVMTRAKPLIIEAATRLGATLNFQVTITGQGIVLRNLATDTIVFQGAKFSSALHCKAVWDGGWTNGRAVYFTNSALFCCVWGCEVRATAWPSGTRPADNLRRNLIFWDGNGWNGQPKWCFVFYCYGPDAPARPDPTNYSSASVAAFIFGDDVSISHIPTNNGMYRSLLSGAKGGHGQIETKMGKVWVIESGIIDSPSVNGGSAANINNRQGIGSEFIRCFNHRGGGFEIHRSSHRLVAPSVKNGTNTRVCAGSGVGTYYDYALVGQSNTFGAASDVRIIRPVGAVVVGEDYNAGSGSSTIRPRPATATQVEGASSVSLDHQTNTNQAYVSGDTTTAAAVELAPAQVGLNAPEGDSLSGMPAEMWQFSAWLDWTKNWQHYKTTGNASSVVQTDTGFEVKAGPNTSTEGTIYVFSRYTVPYANLQLDFDFTRTDGGGGTGAGEAFLVHFGARGKGTALTPTDLSTLDYNAFRVIENEMFCYRLSFGQDSGVSNDDQMRLRIFRADGTAGEQIISTTPTVYPFPQGVPHRIHVQKRGTFIRIIVTRLDTRAVQFVEATDPRLGELTGGGHIGIRCMPGRTGRFESFKITRF